MRNHDTPAGCLRHIAGLDGLSNGADLVNLEEEGIAEFLIDACLHARGVCHEEIIADNLHTVANLLSHLHVRWEVILVKWVLN
jgi:hypothetical protein